MTPVPSPRRRRPRVSVGALMTLVLAVALPAAWMANTIRTQRAALAAVRAANGSIRFDYQEEAISPGAGPPARYRTEPAAPAWLRRWLGDELFQQPREVQIKDQISPAILDAICHFDRLRSLTLDSTFIADRGSLRLERLRSLEDLNLAGPRVNDTILDEVARLPNLRSLRIQDASATDYGFALLAALPKIVNLNLYDCHNLTDAGLARMLAGLPGLRSLYLGGHGPERLTKAVAALARHHPDLESLNVDDPDLTDADLAALGGLHELRFLAFRSQAVTEAGVAHLRSLGRLEQLWIVAQGLTDAGLEPLAELTTLRRLSLVQGRLTDAGMATASRFDRLEWLLVPFNPALTDAGLVPLRRLANLQHLDVKGSKVTPTGVRVLQQAVPKLRSVRAPWTSP